MKAETSILLPSATIDLFLKDEETLAAARSLHADWRFARVRVNVHEGNVEDAIRQYARAASPDMILVETDSTGDDFTGRLGELSSHCAEGTSAVVIGPVNDVNLYRSLTAMGVSDYLVKPVPQHTLGDVIAKGLVQKLGAGGSRLIAVIGAKGGVGTSALAIAMAHTAAENLSQKTMLIDAAGAWSSLCVGLGFEPIASTAEAVKAATGKDADSFKRMQHVAGDKLRVLATGMEAMLELSPHMAQFEEVLNTAMASFPLVVADLSMASVGARKVLLTRANQIVVVSTPSLSSLRSARALINEIKMIQGGADVIDLLINMEGIAPGREVPMKDIKAALEREPSGSIPYDLKIFLGAEAEGRAASAGQPGADIAKRLMPILKKSVNKAEKEKDAPGGGLLGGILGKIRPKGK